MIRKYDDLDVWIDHVEGEVYRARVVHQYAGEACSRFQRPFSEQQLRDLFRELPIVHRDFRPHLPAGDDALRIGQDLFKVVFSGKVLQVLTIAMQRITPTQGLRIRLRLDDDFPELFSWPWELLHGFGVFLALSETMTIVRYLKNVRVFPSFRGALPLRVLVVVSNPPECQALDGKAEFRHIEEALQPLRGWVRVERLQDPSRARLRKSLKRAHVLHFIGHGTSGALILKSRKGKASMLKAEEVAGLVNRSSIRLVVLNACWSAPEDVLAGVAQRLVRVGIPAVIGMQTEIDDRSAVVFAKALYEKLAEGVPVDGALCEARQAVKDESDSRALHWAVPVLFLSSDGVIFHWWRLRFWAALLILLIASLVGIFPPVDLMPKASWTPSPIAQSCPPLRSLDMPMARIPNGEFMMGTSSGEKDESPLRQVRISRAFCLGVHEVTQAQWEQVMGPNRSTSTLQDAQLPVTGISYLDVMEFLKRVNDLEGEEVVRLPTEEEWEYAAQGIGGGWNCLSREHNDGFDGLAPVGSFQPNRLGLRDMLGNAWELVGNDRGQHRIIKGGSYDSAPKNCRATKRGTRKPTSKYQNTGFRVLRELTR